MIKPWFYKDFKPYAEKKGYRILRDDYKFIEHRISRLPEGAQRQAMRQYLKEWDKGLAGMSTSQNPGRFLANQFLLSI